MEYDMENRPPRMTMEWVRRRIRQLIDSTGRSERSLSLELDHSHNYINKITSGKAHPKWDDFFHMVWVMKLTVSDFFDEDLEEPLMISEIMAELRQMNTEQRKDLLNICRQINKTHGSE